MSNNVTIIKEDRLSVEDMGDGFIRIVQHRMIGDTTVDIVISKENLQDIVEAVQ